MPDPKANPVKVTSPLSGRSVAPTGYVPVSAPVAHPVPAMPTPPSQAYSPAASLRSPMPGILTDPDQQRQVYGKGVIVRRFWPVTS